jgi:hypothetical protein
LHIKKCPLRLSSVGFFPPGTQSKTLGKAGCLNFGSRINRKFTVKKFGKKTNKTNNVKEKGKKELMLHQLYVLFRIRESNPLLSLLDIDFP